MPPMNGLLSSEFASVALLLFHMAGGVALLAWGTYMVKSGMLRTFGEGLRQWLPRKLASKPGAVTAGLR